MEKLGHTGLILYTTEAETRGQPRSILRPRPIIYGGLIIGLIATAALIIIARVSFEAEVARSPGSTFVVDPDGSVRNIFLVTIGNNNPSPGPVSYSISVAGLPGAEVLAPAIALAATEDRTVPIVVRMPLTDGPARTIPFQVRIASPKEERLLPATFMTPGDTEEEKSNERH